MGSEKFCQITVLLAAAFTICAGACVKTEDVPMWYRPCGTTMKDLDIDLGPDVPYPTDETQKGQDLNQLNMTLIIAVRSYTNQQYDVLYNTINFGVVRPQYIPNWLPDEDEMVYVRELAKGPFEKVIDNLPNMHVGLQKFAVAFEQMVAHPYYINYGKIDEAHKITYSALQGLLCEVETTIPTLPSLEIPKRVKKTIMSNAERFPAYQTDAMIRDWGIIQKYKEFLTAWQLAFEPNMTDNDV